MKSTDEYEMKTMSNSEWQEKIQKIQLSKKDLNKLIMNFFLVEGMAYLLNDYLQAIKRLLKN